MSFADFLFGYFIDLDDIDSATVLVDYLHYVLEKLLQALAFEFETDQVTCVMSLRL